jgi:response regulator RpfG family c-di-GMP phosphodiesterase
VALGARAASRWIERSTVSQTTSLQERISEDEPPQDADLATESQAGGQHDWAEEARLVIARLERVTGRDVSRLVSLARTLGEGIDLHGKELDILSWSAALFDLGMLSVPEDVVAKGGTLEGEDLEEIRRHPITGAEMILDISQRLGRVAEAARTHHEHWDGHGYPNGLNGYEIPLHGRILAIVDTYDALTSVRPLRRGVFTETGARDYLESQRGKRFDPTLVDVFLTEIGQGDRRPQGAKMVRRRKS